MATVQEVLHLAIEIDMMDLAHRVFWAISKGKVKADDAAEILGEINYDEHAISEMAGRNMLNIGKIKLYVVQTRQADVFAFYYSENVLEAYSLHQELFRETPRRLMNGSHLLGKIFHFYESNTSEILYFHRNKAVAYPYYLGHARAGKELLYRNGK